MAKEVKEKIGTASPDNINKVKISCVAQEKVIGKDGEKTEFTNEQPIEFVDLVQAKKEEYKTIRAVADRAEEREEER